jgi:hypothetical protein
MIGREREASLRFLANRDQHRSFLVAAKILDRSAIGKLGAAIESWSLP